MKKKIIIDCDPGIDDSLALMLALSSQEIEVIGITIVCGNTPVDMGFENAKKILKHMNRLDIPIYIGAKQPLVKEFCSALDTHGSDGLGESFLDHVEGYQQSTDAVTFLANTLLKEKCSIITLGPLTNIAQLIQNNPIAFQNIDTIVSMGGSYQAHGNCSPVAEFNYWEDPEAANLVYQECGRIHKKIHMIGLDVTRKIILTPDLMTYIERLNQKEGDFIRKITKFYFDFHWEWEHLIGCVINDPLAVAYFIDPSICSGFESFVEIETDGIARGQSVVDAHHFYKKPSNTIVLNQVHVESFFILFLSRVLKLSPSQLDLINSFYF